MPIGTELVLKIDNLRKNGTLKKSRNISYRSLSLPEDSRDDAGGGISITPELPEAGAYELRFPFRGPKVEKLRFGWCPWPPGTEAIISEGGTSSGRNSTTYLAGA